MRRGTGSSTGVGPALRQQGVRCAPSVGVDHGWQAVDRPPRGRGPSAGDEAGELRARFGEGTESSDGAPVLRDLERVPFGGSPKVRAEVFAQLPDPDPLHDPQCSTIGVFARADALGADPGQRRLYASLDRPDEILTGLNA